MSTLRKDIRFDRAGPPITTADIDAVRAALGVAALPLDYERYLLRFNGASPVLLGPNAEGVPKQARIWWPAGTVADTSVHAAMLNAMYRIAPGDPLSLVDAHEATGHLLPPATVAFASDPGGSRFLLDLRPERPGQVLFWDYFSLGDEALSAQDPYHNVGWLAADFVDFLNRLAPEPDDVDAWEASLEPDATLDWQPR